MLLPASAIYFRHVVTFFTSAGAGIVPETGRSNRTLQLRHDPGQIKLCKGFAGQCTGSPQGITSRPEHFRTAGLWHGQRAEWTYLRFPRAECRFLRSAPGLPKLERRLRLAVPHEYQLGFFHLRPGKRKDQCRAASTGAGSTRSGTGTFPAGHPGICGLSEHAGRGKADPLATK
jgi:hypothetical protein